jgi:hypothetical protein
VRAARPTGAIDDLPYILDGKVMRKEPLSIEDINRIAAGSGMKISVDTNVLARALGKRLEDDMATAVRRYPTTNSQKRALIRSPRARA